MIIKKLSLVALVGAVVSSCPGCQSWQGAPFPMQNATRVPPPGTGTYQLPNGYYNNATSALPVSQSGQMADAASGLRPATGTFPSTTLPATNLAGPSMAAATTPTAANAHGSVSSAAAPASGSVSSASYVAASASQAPSPTADNPGSQFTAPLTAAAGSAVGESSMGATQAASTEVPSLQWQQFSDQ